MSGVPALARLYRWARFDDSGRRVPRRIKDPNVWRVYLATFLLGLAYGLAISVIAIFLDERGYSKTTIGSLAAWFASGIVALSIPAGALIRRFSAKTTLVVALAGYAISVGVFPLLDSYAALAAIRFVDGACSVTVWVSCETILLSRSSASQKAFVTSLYAVALALGYVVGPITARLIVSIFPLGVAFYVAAGIAAVSAAYVLIRLDGKEPEAEAVETVSADASHETPGPLPVEVGVLQHNLGVLWKIKTSCFATFAYGYFQASVVIFLPLYLIAEKGITTEDTVLVPAFFAGGMLLFANVAGRLGDRLGHLRIMRVLGVIGLGMVLSFAFLNSFVLMGVAVFVAGATLASISPVSLALQGLVVPAADYSRATALYNAFYATGMLMGPPISSVLFDRIGGDAMLFHLTGLWVAFVIFAFVFHRDDPAVDRPGGGATRAPASPARGSVDLKLQPALREASATRFARRSHAVRRDSSGGPKENRA